jgi:hypothetical protein
VTEVLLSWRDYLGWVSLGRKEKVEAKLVAVRTPVSFFVRFEMRTLV